MTLWEFYCEMCGFHVKERMGRSHPGYIEAGIIIQDQHRIFSGKCHDRWNLRYVRLRDPRASDAEWAAIVEDRDLAEIKRDWQEWKAGPQLVTRASV